MFNIAMESGIIYKSDKRKYHYNGLTKQVPNDEEQTMPFEGPSNEEAPY